MLTRLNLQENSDSFAGLPPKPCTQVEYDNAAREFCAQQQLDQKVQTVHPQAEDSIWALVAPLARILSKHLTLCNIFHRLANKTLWNKCSKSC